MNARFAKAAAANVAKLAHTNNHHLNSIHALQKAKREIEDAMRALEAVEIEDAMRALEAVEAEGQIPAVSGITNAMAALTTALAAHSAARAFQSAQKDVFIAIFTTA